MGFIAAGVLFGLVILRIALLALGASLILRPSRTCPALPGSDRAAPPANPPSASALDRMAVVPELRMGRTGATCSHAAVHRARP
jgi:hypothetical protein